MLADATPTLTSVLREAYATYCEEQLAHLDKSALADGLTVLQNCADPFIRFMENYLDKNRVTQTRTNYPSNIGLVLSNKVACVVSSHIVQGAMAKTANPISLTAPSVVEEERKQNRVAQQQMQAKTAKPGKSFLETTAAIDKTKTTSGQSFKHGGE